MNLTHTHTEFHTVILVAKSRNFNIRIHLLLEITLHIRYPLFLYYEQAFPHLGEIATTPNQGC